MNDLERLKRAEEAGPRAVLVLDNIMSGMPEHCADCPLEYDNLCCILVENYYRKKEDGCPLQSAIGIITPDAHVRYFVEENENE